MSTTELASDSEDEFDWEEVAVPTVAQPLELDSEDQAGPSTRPNIEITLETHPTSGKDRTQKKFPGGISHAERLLRIDCHKVHTVALIANASVRNRWLNDDLLQARLLSLTPLAVQNSFAMIHKSRIPDAVKRGSLFEQAVSRLASWWADTFFTLKPTGHLRSRTFEDVQRVLHSSGLIDTTGKGKGKALPEDVDPLEDLFEDGEVEVVRSAKSLMKHALMRSGSRDVSSQLFTALCRALDIPARLVVSLQSVPWKPNVGLPKTLGKSKRAGSKGKAAMTPHDSDNVSKGEHSPVDDMQVDDKSADETPSSGTQKISHTVKLRKTTRSRLKMGSLHPPKPSDPLTTPPVFWTEVFSRPDGRWLPVDPIRAIVNKRKVFDPTPTGTSSRLASVDNRMMYVLAVEEDGYMRDVTPRYAKQYIAKVSKVQSGGRGRQEWWAQVVQAVTRPYRLHRDDVEDDELVVNQFTEGMPTTLGDFKNHPFYVLERHLLRDQIISSDAHELGKFRGEPVYSRSQVLQLKAAENWMRHGRVVRAGEQPLKFVKQRAATLNRKRELEIRANMEGANGSNSAMQGLYAERQTEIYIPPPVIDGRIPKNSFGNIDLYTPSMLPAGAMHIPHKGAAKIARQLGFDYAEAVTSFEFRKGKACPVISGIVVAAENEDIILEAYWEAEHVTAQKEQEKRQQAVLKRWTKLVHGLRIRQRMREEYGAPSFSSTQHGVDAAAAVTVEDGTKHDEDGTMSAAGGFLTGVEDVVQHYNLPRPVHVVFSSPPRSPQPDVHPSTPSPSEVESPLPLQTTIGSVPTAAATALDMPISGNDFSSDDDDREEEGSMMPSYHHHLPGESNGRSSSHPASGEDRTNGRRSRGMPKSMAELAAETAAKTVVSSPSPPPPPPPRTAASKGNARPKTKPKSKRVQTQTQGRKRARGNLSESVNNVEDENGDDDDADDEKLRVATKRARTRTQNYYHEGSPGGGADGVVKSDRVLRTRKGKSAEQLAREREQELAVKRAMAG